MRRISRKQMAEAAGLSVRTIDRMLKDIERLSSSRYPANSVIRTPRVRIRDDVARDYTENMDAVRSGTAKAFKEV